MKKELENMTEQELDLEIERLLAELKNEKEAISARPRKIPGN